MTDDVVHRPEFRRPPAPCLPGRCLLGRCLPAFLCLGALTALRLILAAVLPVTPDEAYYWVWSRHLQPGYLDHPFMVALWIRAGTWLCGDTALGLRLLGPFSAALGTCLIMLAARDFSRDPTSMRRPVIAGILLNATLAVGIGAFTMTPDTPLLFFVSLFLWSVGRLLATGDPRWWLSIGLAAGLGFDSKYTMILLVGGLVGSLVCGLAVWSLATPGGRRGLASAWFWSVWFWAGAVCALGLSGPVIWWNAAHHWASFLKQGGRTGDWHPARALGYLGELLGGQVGLLTPGIFLLAVLALVRAFRRPDSGGRLLLWLAGVPIAVFVQHAAGDRVQANWPVLIYPVLVVLIAVLRPQGWRVSAACGFLLSTGVILQAVTGVLPLNRHLDVMLRQGGGWDAFARTIEARSADAPVVASDDYGLASELAFHLRGRTVVGMEPRWALFGLPSWQCAGSGLFVHNARRPLAGVPGWGWLGKPYDTVVRARWGREAERYELYRIACPVPSLQSGWMRALPLARR